MEKKEAVGVVIRELKKRGRFSPQFEETINTLIPELKESEDERIRKEIITYLSTIDDKGLVPYDSWIAWLEKQGEHKPVISDEAIREGVAHFGITQYQINNWLKKYIDVEKQGEKKEQTRHPDMVANLKKYLANTPKEQHGKQNPVWSKEDEKMFEFWNLYYDHKVGDMPNKDVIENLEKFRDWLKSLKERYTWKPSDEQMELLREVQQALLGKDCHNRFVNFMYELKKLKG